MSFFTTITGTTGDKGYVKATTQVVDNVGFHFFLGLRAAGNPVVPWREVFQTRFVVNTQQHLNVVTRHCGESTCGVEEPGEQLVCQ